jgi:hypothetical protein
MQDPATKQREVECGRERRELSLERAPQIGKRAFFLLGTAAVIKAFLLTSRADAIHSALLRRKSWKP